MWLWRPIYHIPDDKWWWWWWLWWWSCLLPIKAGSHCWKIWHEGLELSFFHAPGSSEFLIAESCSSYTRDTALSGSASTASLQSSRNLSTSRSPTYYVKFKKKTVITNNAQLITCTAWRSPSPIRWWSSEGISDLQPPYLCNWQQAWDVVRKYFAFWSCEILTLLCILVYCSRSTPAHWVLGLSDQNGRTWPRNGGWFFLKFHNKLFKVMLGKPTSGERLREEDWLVNSFDLESLW